MDVELSAISRVEYIHDDDNLLSAVRRYKGLRTYPSASDRAQRALHNQMLRLAERGLVELVGRDGNTMQWKTAL